MSEPATNERTQERNTRKVFEEIIEENLISATKVLELVRQVGDALFGAKPSEVGEKESATSPGGVFNGAKDVALKTKYRLGEAREELEEIIKEIK
jgi:hypothetical protein